MSQSQPEKTDYSRWRLKTEHGRQTWEYLKSDEAAAAWPQSLADKYHLGLDLVRAPPKDPEALMKLTDVNRTSLLYQNLKPTSMQPVMPSISFPSFSSPKGSGRASTEVRIPPTNPQSPQFNTERLLRSHVPHSRMCYRLIRYQF